MAAPVNYQYDPGSHSVPHRINAKLGTETVGHLEWNGEPKDTFNHVQEVFVEPSMRRKGIATEMWKHAHHISTQFDNVNPPSHNPSRTDKGDAWAKSVGGYVPTRHPIESY